jgi:hypothetical protein
LAFNGANSVPVPLLSKIVSLGFRLGYF